MADVADNTETTQATTRRWRAVDTVFVLLWAAFAVFWLAVLRRLIGGLAFDYLAVVVAFAVFLGRKFLPGQTIARRGWSRRELLLFFGMIGVGLLVATSPYYDHDEKYSYVFYLRFYDAESHGRVPHVSVRGVDEAGQLVTDADGANAWFNIDVEFGFRLLGNHTPWRTRIVAFEASSPNYQPSIIKMAQLIDDDFVTWRNYQGFFSSNPNRVRTFHQPLSRKQSD